jgi:hypothetical protein
MKAEFGRSFMWFLEPRSEASYQLHHQDVIDDVPYLAWRCLKGIVVDKRLFPEANQYPQLLKGFTSKVPNAEHYAEITGKGQWLKRIDAVDYLTLVSDDAPNTIIHIPFKAIVSNRSTGYPKVAYNVEQYLIGYRYILKVLTEGLHDSTVVLSYLEPLMFSRNFSPVVYDAIKKILDEIKLGKQLTQTTVQTLESLMVEDMLTSIPQQCKGMYHHALAWHVRSSSYQGTDPIAVNFRKLLIQFPNILPGRAFVPVKPFKED